MVHKPKSLPFEADAVERELERFLKALPRFIYIEPTNACNLRCVMCPTGRGETRVKKNRMELAFFREILAGASGLEPAEILFLHKDGEPLLHPEIVEMVRIAKESGVSREVAFATNAMLLEREISKELIAAGVNEIYVSIESLDPARYAGIRVGAELEVVIENVKRFIEIKGGKGRGPRLVITTINMGCTALDVVQIFEEWSGLADRVQVVERYGWAGRYNEELPRPKMKRVNPCAGLWYLMAISAGGDVNLCCLDAGSTYPIASLKEERISDVWRGEKYRELRRLHLEGACEKIPLCSHCVDGDINWIERALSELP